MAIFTNNIYTLDEFSKLVEGQIFGFKNLDPVDLMDSFDGIKEKAEESERQSRKVMKSMMGMSDAQLDGFAEKLGKELEENPSEFREKLKSGTLDFIKVFFKDKTITKDGYCLKYKIKGKAVQMKHDYTMLGFISELIPNESRFVMVDFGDAEGAVKLDVGELNFD